MQEDVKVMRITTNFNERTVYVRVILNGRFSGSGKAVCHNQDEFIPEAGYRIAYLRAVVDAYKDYKRYLTQEVKEIDHFVSALEQYKNFNSEEPSAKAVYRAANRKKRELELVKETIKAKIEDAKQFADSQ